jgi:hypothetical protein
MTISYKPVFLFANDERSTNAQTFATWQEANDSAAARFIRWTMPLGFDVDESQQPVTYQFIDGQDVRIIK